MLPGKSLTPADIIAILKRRYWLVLVPPVLTLFAALLYTSRIANVYQSDMLIAVDPQRVPDIFVRSTVTLGADRRLDSITVQVLSRTNLEKLVTKFKLYERELELLPMDDVVRRMRDDISVELERTRGQDGPTAFHVRFTHRDPQVAAAVTQELGSLFVSQNSQDRATLATATNGFLEQQLAEARKRLEEQDRKVEAFRQQHGKALPTQMSGNLQALQSLQLQVQSTVDSIARDRDRKQMLERLYRDALAEPAPRVATRTDTGTPGANLTAQQQLANARDQLASLLLKYTEDHPDVGRARRLIAELEPRAAAEAAAAKNAAATMADPASLQDPRQRESLRQMKAEMESLDRQIAYKESEEVRLRAGVADYQARIDAVPGLESEWLALTRDYETQQAEYKDLLTKSGNANLAKELEEQKIGETFRIVDPASVPVHPIPSIRGRINALGGAFGLALGVAIVLLLELRDTSFRSDTDVMEVLGIPVLASVPYTETAAEVATRQRRSRLIAGVGACAVAIMAYVTWTLKLWNSLV